jgi:hypothetical protein
MKQIGHEPAEAIERGLQLLGCQAQGFLNAAGQASEPLFHLGEDGNSFAGAGGARFKLTVLFVDACDLAP